MDPYERSRPTIIFAEYTSLGNQSGYPISVYETLLGLWLYDTSVLDFLGDLCGRFLCDLCGKKLLTAKVAEKIREEREENRVI
jgi:hypothetical protein